MSFRNRILFSFFGLGATLSVSISLILTQQFIQDQRGYQVDLQMVAARSARDQIQMRFQSLYENIGRAGPHNLRLFIASDPFWKTVTPLTPEQITKPKFGWELSVRDAQHLVWRGNYGTIVAALALSFDRITDLLPNLQGVESVLLSKTGQVSDFQSKIGPLPSSLISEIFSSPSGNVLSKTLPGTQFLDSRQITTATIDPSRSIAILLETPKTRINQAVGSIFPRVFVTLAVVFLLFSIVVMLMFRAITKTFRDLLDLTSQSLSATSVTIESRSLNRNDEFGSFARSFVELLTQFRESQDKIKRAEQLSQLGQMSASIAHALKNPLTALLGTVQVLKERFVKNSTLSWNESQAMVDVIETEAIRTGQLIQDMLKLTPKPKRALETVDLVHQVNSCLRTLDATLKTKGITVSFGPGKEPALVKARSDELQEVLSNLINNACDAMETSSSKHLSLRIDQSKSGYRLSIHDTGLGIQAEHLPRIFEPFFTTKGFSKGTGLGLAIAAQMIQDLDGTIDVQSQPGLGTTFGIEFSI